MEAIQIRYILNPRFLIIKHFPFPCYAYVLDTDKLCTRRG